MTDSEVNMIFGAVIDETLKDDIKVTVIATGFEHKNLTAPMRKPTGTGATTGNAQESSDSRLNNLRPFGGNNNGQGDQLDIPTFLRNRNRNNFDK